LAHVAQCSRCRAFLTALDAIDGRRSSFGPLVDEDVPKRGKWKIRVAAVAGVGLASCGIAYLLGAPAANGWRSAAASDADPPSVQLVIHRAGEAFFWNGTMPVETGDELVFRVACAAQSRVAVAIPGAENHSWMRVQDDECLPGPAATLPTTRRVGKGPEVERFVIVVSREKLDANELSAAASTRTRTPDVWAIHFEVPKSR
jgi:hypothetical protein